MHGAIGRRGEVPGTCSRFEFLDKESKVKKKGNAVNISNKIKNV
jgi:hypothetical protein